jgi:hypothetical protein
MEIHRNKSVVSDLFMYYCTLVMRILELSLGKNNPYVSSHVLNMLISYQFEQVWAFGCGNITEYTHIDLLIHTCVHKQHFNSVMGRPKPYLRTVYPAAGRYASTLPYRLFFSTFQAIH